MDVASMADKLDFKDFLSNKPKRDSLILDWVFKLFTIGTEIVKEKRMKERDKKVGNPFGKQFFCLQPRDFFSSQTNWHPEKGNAPFFFNSHNKFFQKLLSFLSWTDFYFQSFYHTIHDLLLKLKVWFWPPSLMFGYITTKFHFLVVLEINKQIL